MAAFTRFAILAKSFLPLIAALSVLMRITIDINTRALGIIAFIGLTVIGVYHYHTAIKSTLPNAEVLELKEICIFIFFMLLPFFAAMFGNRKDLKVDKSEIAKMGRFRQILNSPKGVELI